MARMDDSNNDSITAGPEKPVWTSPKLEELGNLSDFVRMPGMGKSGLDPDGVSGESNFIMSMGPL
jgi:hypothetical protein